jgi:predicted Zn-dependent peptidase
MAFDFQRMERDLKQRGRINTLPNGVRIVSEDSPGFGLVRANITVNSGSLIENPSDLGVMHFLEHMGFNGTALDPERVGLEAQLERLGAQKNANTSGRRIEYPILGSNQTGFLMEDCFLEVFEIYHGIVTAPLLREADVDKERKIVLREVREYEQSRSTPFREIVEGMYERLYGNNHEPPTLGTDKTIAGINAGLLSLYHRKHFVGANTTVSVMGDIGNGEDVLTRVYEFMGQMSKGQASKTFDWKKEIPFVGTELVEHDAPVPQPLTTIEILYAVPGEGDFVTRNLLNHVLGKNLFEEVREQRGLVYSISSRVNGHEGTTYITIEAKVNPNQLTSALEGIEQSVANIRAGRVGKNVLNGVIQMIKPQHLMALRGCGWIRDELLLRMRAEERGIQRESFEGLRGVLSATPDKIVQAANSYLGNDKLVHIVHATAEPTMSQIAQGRVPYVSSLF